MVQTGIQRRLRWRFPVTKPGVFDQYNTVNVPDLGFAAGRLQTYVNQEKVTLAVTLAELRGGCAEGGANEVINTMGENLVPPIRIERTTRGLGMA
jgi:hypothetical protein